MSPVTPARTIEVGHRTIGAGRTFLVADIGSNHNQDLELALDTIDAAADAGADAVKFQSLDVGALYREPDGAVRALYARIDLREDWYPALAERCARRGVLFCSSPTYLRAVDLLESVGVRLYKLASAQVGTFPQLVSRVAAAGKPVILSTGIVTAGELEACLGLVAAAGNANVVVLHCNAIYPTPYARVHLPRMDAYRRMFGCLVGYSDHTDEDYVALAAVARGASVIEKHFTTSRALPTPDAVVAMEPPAFARMAAGIRAVEQALVEKPRLELEPEEAAFKASLRYRLVLARARRAGEAFAPGDFEYLRHPSGVDCRSEALVVARFAAAADLPAGTLLDWPMLVGR
jgi:sialic acid synthase SpsE